MESQMILLQIILKKNSIELHKIMNDDFDISSLEIELNDLELLLENHNRVIEELENDSVDMKTNLCIRPMIELSWDMFEVITIDNGVTVLYKGSWNSCIQFIYDNSHLYKGKEKRYEI